MKEKNMFSTLILNKADKLMNLARGRGVKIGLAESCTGGLVAAALTEVAGSSDVFERGFVTYSNEAKNQMLGVRASLLETHGAVSMEVARAMALGVLGAAPPVGLSLSVTGVAGPGGGSDEKPVGLVHFGVAIRAENGSQAHFRADKQIFEGVRMEVRHASVSHGLDLMIAALKE